jgi:hypothetical protein
MIHDPPCHEFIATKTDILRLGKTGSTMVGHAVVNPRRPGECVGQSLADACGEFLCRTAIPLGLKYGR